MNFGKPFARALAAGFLLTGVAHGDSRSTTEKIETLERRQQELDEELRELRREVEQAAESKQDVDEVQRRQGILTDELQRLREALVLPEKKELKSVYGLGPAASKVYGTERGLSIGGYGEAHLKKVVSDRGKEKDTFDFLRLVLYVGYKFNDWIVFNSETEFEHASTGKDGEVSVEFATLDFLLHPMANARAGLLLVPVGFINEIHEPPFFHGNDRPLVERQIIPATWRANGFGLFGELLPGLEYRTYGITSLDAKEFSSSGIRGGRQSGSEELGEDFSWVGRLDYTLLPGTLIGGSIYLGDQGQNQSYGGKDVDVFMQMYEAHFQVRTHGLELRGLGAVIDLDNARALSTDPDIDETIANLMYGWYTEIAYDVMPLILPETTQYLAPWFRYERFDTQSSVPLGLPTDETRDREAWEFGLSYKPISQVVLKIDYRIADAARGSLADELRIGEGFVFLNPSRAITAARIATATRGAAACLVVLLSTAAGGTVFHSRDEALQLAFPDADRVEARNFFLTAEQRSAIEARAKAPLESDLLTVYVGHRAEQTAGYAILDTHVVRTLPETFLVVMSPSGLIVGTHLLAFHEPLEYVPAERWLLQFEGKQLADELRLGREIAAITGSTLTSQAVAASVRRALAIHDVLLKGG